ncbi:L-aspartate oxidase [Alteribacter populi]|uniref:L-aspartate oxidase n=1 Tax=Alteribacter populi TaxID=2011011 RepID=UPI000BBAAA55|nr:L-aspartate oxidase [Alteribacter populi]
MKKKNVIIVGSGLAALTAVKKLAEHFNVIVFTKSLSSGSSWKAQGGIAAGIYETDNGEQHKQDTIRAGGGHNDPRAVELLVCEGEQVIREWIKEGMVFDNESNGQLALGMEGAHSVRRILHAGGDQTGKKMMEYLLGKEVDVELYTDKHIIDLIHLRGECKGVYVKDTFGQSECYEADAVILATGGYGGLYEASSNDQDLVGEGLALAYRAGATLTDLEFTQFHPTLLWTEGHSRGLVSEAVRGEGGVLVDEQNNPLMGWHPLKDLAPRDVVARTLFQNVKRNEAVYLNINNVRAFKTRFPTIEKLCSEAGVHVEAGRIPVRPGAHFSIGGIETDLNGRTSVPGLYAIGEVACTGVHGANRLASNSLLEAIVFGKRAAEHIVNGNSFDSCKPTAFLMDDFMPVQLPGKEEVIQKVSYAVGIEKNANDLQDLIKWCEGYGVKRHLHSFRGSWTKEELKRSNMLITAWLLASSSLLRTETRGTHYRADFSTANDLRWQGQKVRRNKLENKWMIETGNERSNQYEQVDA